MRRQLQRRKGARSLKSVCLLQLLPVPVGSSGVQKRGGNGRLQHQWGESTRWCCIFGVDKSHQIATAEAAGTASAAAAAGTDCIPQQRLWDGGMRQL